MKQVLIFTAGFGEGHNTAARNIRDALEVVAGNEVRVQIIDLFDRCYGRLNEFLRRAYIAALNRTPRGWGKIYNMIDGKPIRETNLPMLTRVERALAEIL